ncbi:helix-turn-helix transcriptional regulator [Streptomyces sp. FH025]|uniref:helix-turn-helix transcriptional regulator n=1 Tax=Streptomyces sp. FH025 TaxID=2815937 RepID=UPI001A9FF2EB|nr:helix-turn-helix transcriptional regulator [Streptomyces sp. FH025]MBO1413234.1 helix-turn-helix domain-containing protein [Streptomyces sp. FH025]
MTDSDLRDFLRSRRARVTPEAAGLPRPPGIRRVPGLRREEVAQLAGVSVDYYVRLERGRNPHASAAVLDAVARALKLDPAERDHLFALARPARRQPRQAPETVRPGLLHALDNITGIPALILDHRLDVLAMNRLARTFYPSFDQLPPGAWNMARFMFLDTAARELYADWAETARENVGMLRLHAGRNPQDEHLARLVDDLTADPDFRRLWNDQNVYRPTYGTKRYRHPVVGELTLGFEAFTPAGAPHQTLGLYPVEPGSPSEVALRML